MLWTIGPEDSFTNIFSRDTNTTVSVFLFTDLDRHTINWIGEILKLIFIEI